jgi:hypothetical protein
MPALGNELRNKLERTVIEARDVAEAGARAALEALAVHHHEPYPHQTPEQRKLRNHLRARARQLGDAQNSRGGMSIDHLVHECAYEHWHRMLFARFLAENDLLIEPSSGVAISLQECEELAKEAQTDLWTYASRCAQQMLPQIFRPDDPLLQVTPAREHRVKLEQLLAGLDSSIFRADDSLGWVYQFWQSKKKDEVNAAGEKITGDTLPAVTQLFTEHYMVLFLLHNTVGAWHAGKVLASNPTLADSAESEDQLRRAVALSTAGGYSFDYLRFVRGPSSPPSPGTPGRGEGPWRPAAGTFDGWPKRAAEIKLLDPCCGSGHFDVAGFELLVRLRMHEEDLSLPDAVGAVLRDNIFGLELDARCTQIAAFNLALAAWKMVGFRKLPALNIACTGLGPGGKKEDWVALAGDDARLRAGMERLYDLFRQASELGSLIDPKRTVGIGDIFASGFHELEPVLHEALARQTVANNVDRNEMGVSARGIAHAATMLASTYILVITNVPYLGRGKQDNVLKDYCERNYPEAKADLANCFVERCLAYCNEGGTAALVTPQNWLFLATYKKLRTRLLQTVEWNQVARLGPRAFETSSGEVVKVALLAFSRHAPATDHTFAGLGVAEDATPEKKDAELRVKEVTSLPQMEQLGNPDAVILLSRGPKGQLLSDVAFVVEGLSTGDSDRYVRRFWELNLPNDAWEFFQGPPQNTLPYGGRECLLHWESGQGPLQRSEGARIQGSGAWGKSGVIVGQMWTMKCTLYHGQIHDKITGAIIPKRMPDLPAIWAFCESHAYNDEIRKINQKLNVATGTLVKVPFNLAHWRGVVAEKYPHGLPKPHSDDPTQWLFAGYLRGAEQPLQVAVARLLGYHWPRQTGSSFPDCPALGSDGLESHADADGIVCIPSVRGEEPAADRLLALLTACGIKPDRDLDDWLRNSFFEEHCKLFHHRPFIWHIWDGRKRDGFHALVNYHKLAEGGGKGRNLLENLTYSYLGEWITRQLDGVKRDEDGAEDRLAAALELRKRLVAILEGDPPFDLFVRWKPLHEQPICWEPDINDGVRINIRPFMASDLPNGRADAGVLRWKPNIKWEKDRGKEPDRAKPDFPWFWGWDGKTLDFMGGKEFTGERFNDCHYTLAAKRRAREAAGKSKEGARR